MNTAIKYAKKSFSLCKTTLTILLLFPIILNAQVDKWWLKSWNEANKKRPTEIFSKSRIASKNEPGTPLIVKGKIFNPNGTPAVNVIVHSYHRDDKGYDFVKHDKVLKTWRLQGWAKTDANGNFEFKTIRPATDYLGRDGAHIHFTLISKKYGKQWAPTVFFDDDPMITDSKRLKSKKHGKYGWIPKVYKTNETQYIQINIKLKKKKDF